ncbi:MAG: HAD family phosphatase [Propionibacteriaceae bacterium]|nr:HAD family phosphatase [Propionibacteriaceae bacterium]
MSVTVRPSPAAVFWDYDGTLVDTQPVWLQVEKDIVASYGGVWTDEQGFAAVGIHGLQAAAMLIETIGDPSLDVIEMDNRRCSMVAERVAHGELTFRPGARELIEQCVDHHIPCVLVSASPRFVLDAGLSRMPSTWFTATIGGDEITHAKPHPQGYLLAAERLGVDPTQCLVIEDSAPGCEAGRASGASVLGIPNMTPLEELPGQVVRARLTDVDVKDLGDICTAARRSLR